MHDFKQRVLTATEGRLVQREMRQISTSLAGAESDADRRSAIDECMRRWGQMPPLPVTAGSRGRPGPDRDLNGQAQRHVRPGEPGEDQNAR